jgi:hypothetical protein
MLLDKVREAIDLPRSRVDSRYGPGGRWKILRHISQSLRTVVTHMSQRIRLGEPAGGSASPVVAGMVVVRVC